MSTSVFAFVALLAAPHAPLPAPVQAPVTPPAASSPLGLKAQPFTFSVKGGILGTVSVQAKQIETKAIVERLKAELKIPIEASPVVAQHKVDLALKYASTSTLFFALAPVVFADLELSPGDEPRWTAIHLIGYNEKGPPPAVKQTGFLLFAGVPVEDGSVSPEEAEAKAASEVARALGAEPKDDKPVLVVVVAPDGQVSLKSRKQPLIAILNEVAIKSKVPIDLQGSVDMTPIDIDIRDVPLRDLGVAIGRPEVRLIVRRNLATGEESVQGILAGDAQPRNRGVK